MDLTPTTDGDGTMSRVITNRETNEVLTSDPVDVGEYRAVYSVSEGKNYTEESVSYDFAITQAPLTITAEDKSVTMGDVAPEYTVIYDGFVNGEDDSVLAGTLNFICDYEPKKIEKEYVIIPSGLTGNNYAITWVNGTLKATRRYSNLSDNDFDDRKKRISQQIPKEDRYLIRAAFSQDPSSQRAIWQRAEHRMMDSATG